MEIAAAAVGIEMNDFELIDLLFLFSYVDVKHFG